VQLFQSAFKAFNLDILAGYVRVLFVQLLLQLRLSRYQVLNYCILFDQILLVLLDLLLQPFIGSIFTSQTAVFGGQFILHLLQLLFYLFFDARNVRNGALLPGDVLYLCMQLLLQLLLVITQTGKAVALAIKVSVAFGQLLLLRRNVTRKFFDRRFFAGKRIVQLSYLSQKALFRILELTNLIALCRKVPLLSLKPIR